MTKMIRITGLTEKFSVANDGKAGTFGLELSDGTRSEHLISSEGLATMIFQLQQLADKLHATALAAGQPNPVAATLHPDAMDPMLDLECLTSKDGTHVVLRATMKSGRTAHLHIPALSMPSAVAALQQAGQSLRSARVQGKTH